MRKKIVILMGVLVGMVGIPAIINYIGMNISIKSGTDFGDWLGFWGSYLGGFVTLTGVYLAFYLDSYQNRKEKFYENYYHVLHMKVWLRESNNLFEKLLEKIEGADSVTKHWLIKKIKENFFRLDRSIGSIYRNIPEIREDVYDLAVLHIELESHVEGLPEKFYLVNKIGESDESINEIIKTIKDLIEAIVSLNHKLKNLENDYKKST